MAVAAGMALTSLSACGSGGSSSSATPAQTVNSAISADLGQPGLQMVFSLKGSPNAFTGSGSTLTTAQAQYLLRSQLVVTVHGKGSTPVSQVSSTNGPNSLEIALVDKSANLADLRYLGSTLYARVDIPQITNAYGLDRGSAATLRQGLNEIATQIPAASALNKGQWISVDAPGALGLVPGASANASAAGDPGALVKVVAALLGSLRDSGPVQSTNQGYLLTVHGKDIANQLAQAVSSTPGASSVPGLNSLGQKANSVSASATARVTAVVDNGRVTELILALNQLNGNKLHGPASLDVSVATAGAVATPGGVTAVNLQQLSQLIAQARSRSGGGTT